MRQKGALILLVLLLAMLPWMNRWNQTGEALLDRQRERAFQGVLELWLCETFPVGRGSLSGWVEAVIRQYEKQTPGVYIRLRAVSPGVAEKRVRENDALPDAILCGGVIDAGAWQRCDSAAVQVFNEAVSRNGQCLAYPVAAGAYTVLYQADYLRAHQTEPVLTEILAAGLPAGGKNQPKYRLLCGAERWRCPMAALLARDDGSEALLPEHSGKRKYADTWADFVLDRAGAGFLCTQKEVFRIQTLQAGGNAFDWVYEKSPFPYTDQLLALYLPENGYDAARNEAARTFARMLQGDEAQKQLSDYGAFSVTGAALYPPESCMGVMEQALRADGLLIPNQFEWAALSEKTERELKNALSVQERVRIVRRLLDRLRDEPIS